MNHLEIVAIDSADFGSLVGIFKDRIVRDIYKDGTFFICKVAKSV